jgi:hypothetical protein
MNRGRLKVMLRSEAGLPKMFQRYNGKPTLMTRSSRSKKIYAAGKLLATI